MAGGGGAAAVGLADGSGDPVREVMAEHRVLCERAVDPLEIAAGLAEAGLGPAAAARCRHADLFSLAEELYARVPRRPPSAEPAEPAGGRQRRRGAALRTAGLAVLPCAAAAALGGSRPVLLVAAVPLALVPAAAGTAGAGGAAAVPWVGPGPGEGPEAELGPAGPEHGRTGPPAGTRRWWDPAARGAGLAALLLVPLAVAADGPEERRVTAALVLAAALSTGSAEWAARWYRQVGRGHLGAAATLAEFRSRMRPVLPVALALHLAVLAVLSFAALAVLTALAPRPGPAHGGGLLHLAAERAEPAQWAAQGVLGLLLVLPVLLARCGRPAAAALGALAGAAGTAAPPAPSAGLLGGGAVALALLLYAWPVLGRPDAHR
ncbi:hypothetical protein ADK60_40665 [Streptomyces sp. XY431]|uniref:hypothetical protein n=1 Tax=Streptomyces sp. XY431 TaxID=1415562 RepID=UPI0006AD84DB|nr:hypothetical protein [Streptomyces sp. XY431]KOV09577.1 hypothetical protein ADK60_40665 [Streptomyces sp. XY431]